MSKMTTRLRLDEMRGRPVYDNDGEKIGKVEEIYYDPQTRVPEWVGIGTGFLGTKHVVVPVDGAAPYDDGLMVAYAKDYVRDSPDIDGDAISDRDEADLTAYYRLANRGGRSEAGITEQRRHSGDGRESESITRSEEELEVGTRPVDVGRARLRKWVETEPVALDVELRREVARVTREPIDEPVGDHDFAEEHVDVPLRGEKPVVQKQAVAKERVGVEKDVRTEKETVKDELRKERVDVEGDVDERR